MTIKIGSSSIKSIYLGDTAVKSAYLGNVLVYGSQIDTPVNPPIDTESDSAYNFFVFNVKSPVYKQVFLQDYRAGDETEWDGLTDWGDGTVNTERTHRYETDGVYTVKTKYMINDYIYRNSSTVEMLIRIDNINKNITMFSHLFCGCRYLTSIDLDFSVFNMSDMLYTAYMFYNCYDLTSLDLSSLDTSNMMYMNHMFYFCQSLTSLDLSNFDTSNALRMDNMFRYCKKLTYLDLSNFNMDNDRLSYENMFYGCDSLTLDNIIMTNCSELTKSKIIEAYNNKNTLQEDFGDEHH